MGNRPPQDAAPPRLADALLADEVAVIVHSVDGFEVGDQVAVGPNDVVVGGWALVTVAQGTLVAKVRRLQLIEESHRGNPGQPSDEEAEYWRGTRRRRGTPQLWWNGVLINPVLAKHIAKVVRADSIVAQERRKAKEERAAAKAAPKK